MVPAPHPLEGMGQWKQPGENSVLRNPAPVARLDRPSVAPFMPFVADALYQALGAGRSVHLADWPRACPEWVDNDLAAEMRSVRKIVTLARSVRERLGIRHRHPLPVLYIAGADDRLIARHADLLEQEVNVKRVAALTDPGRFVKTEIRLHTPTLGKRLKHLLKTLQQAVAAGDYVIGADGTLACRGMVVAADEYSYRQVVLDPQAPVAADGAIVVLLDTTRDGELRLEADARDLNRTVQDLRKRARLDYSDRILLSVTGSGLDVLLNMHGAWLMEQSLASELVASVEDPDAAGTVVLNTGGAEVAIGGSKRPHARSVTRRRATFGPQPRIGSVATHVYASHFRPPHRSPLRVDGGPAVARMAVGLAADAPVVVAQPAPCGDSGLVSGSRHRRQRDGAVADQFAVLWRHSGRA